MNPRKRRALKLSQAQPTAEPVAVAVEPVPAVVEPPPVVEEPKRKRATRKRVKK